MKKVTKAQAAKLEKLYATKEAARNVVYSFGHRQATLSECIALATNEARQAYIDASEAVYDFESDLVYDGRGWRDSYRQFKSY